MPSGKAKSALLPVPLLRYRFGSSAKIDQHFHEVDGQTLFFYPASLPFRDGQWVFVEFSVSTSDVCCLVRGRLHEQYNARFNGGWLEFPVTGFAEVLRGLDETRRSNERLAIDITTIIRRDNGTQALCRTSDVSAGGLRLSGLPFLLETGEEISIHMVGGPRGQSLLARGNVAWMGVREAGVQLQQAVDPRGTLATILAHAASARQTAVEISHPDLCPCRHGARPEEPAFPESVLRRSKTAARG